MNEAEKRGHQLQAALEEAISLLIAALGSVPDPLGVAVSLRTVGVLNELEPDAGGPEGWRSVQDAIAGFLDIRSQIEIHNEVLREILNEKGQPDGGA